MLGNLIILGAQKLTIGKLPSRPDNPHRMSYQYEEENQRAEGAEDDVDGDEDGEVVELGTLGVALRV